MSYRPHALSGDASQLGKEIRNRLGLRTVEQKRHNVVRCARPEDAVSYVVEFPYRDVTIETALRKRVTRWIEALRDQPLAAVQMHLNARRHAAGGASNNLG